MMVWITDDLKTKFEHFKIWRCLLKFEKVLILIVYWKKNDFVTFFQWSDQVVPIKAIRERPFCAVVLFSPKQKKKKEHEYNN